MSFEIEYFFLKKKYLISNLIIYFRFPRACVPNYTMHELLYLYTAYCEFCTLLRVGLVGLKILEWENPGFCCGYFVMGAFFTGDFVVDSLLTRPNLNHSLNLNLNLIWLLHEIYILFNYLRK